ncbi:hypothetical protein TcasGA2_TC014884 [Tribolium castaneum]|uniref:Uncharacterized protein n=1 Tax=Tribolium castaneum TaxID=7070 RepID=D2A473_TRICA|nr:hypothetical protein TcasGA2_TC014884 [Tribolium castaneum]
MGSTVSIILRIRNLSNSDISSLCVYDFDSFDFGTLLRPDKVFNGKSVPVKGCLERTIELSTISSKCPFTTRIQYQNGLEDVFRLNYKHIFDDSDPNFNYLNKSHDITCNKTGPRVVELIIRNTEEQIEDQKAEKLISDGCKLMKCGKYTEASVKFLEASQKANQETTILSLRKSTEKLKTVKANNDDDKRAKTLNNEGLQLLKTSHFDQALRKFGEALKLVKTPETATLIEDNFRIAREAKVNQDAKKLNQEGLQLQEQNQNETAVLKFDEALRLALDVTLLNSIKSNKAEALKLEGEKTLQEAWRLDNSPEAVYKFAKAKYLLQESEILKPSNSDKLEIIEYKTLGDRFFNTALQLEHEGARLVDKSLKTGELYCKSAKDKYDSAWKHYKKAKDAYLEGRQKGDENFDRWLELTEIALSGIGEILNELEKTELEMALT